MKKENLDKIIVLRHFLHQHAELSMQENETSSILRTFLAEHTGFEVIDRGSWFYAVKRGHPGNRKIAFRADMDALPIPEDGSLPYHSENCGISHRCGHDGHAAALCGTALELDQAALQDTVYLIFQPGEETGQGAVLCRELIRQEGISEIYALHNRSGFPEKSLVYRFGLTQPSSEGIRIRLYGRTAHASAPEEGCNPAGVMAETVLFLSEMAQKSFNGEVLCTVTGIRLGNGDFGISPGEGELCLTLRAEYENELKHLETEVINHVKMLCRDRGIRVESSVHDYFPETRNDDRCLQKMLSAASKRHMDLISMDKIWRASEDFGWYLKECPGAIAYIGNGENYPALHTDTYDFNDGILETAVDLLVDLATG